MEKKNHIGEGIAIIGVIVLAVVGAGVLTYFINEHHMETYRLAQEKIMQNNSCSDEYRQGWLDCIEAMKVLDCRAENVTMDAFISK